MPLSDCFTNILTDVILSHVRVLAFTPDYLVSQFIY